MSRKIENLNWQSVALEGLPITTDKFQGFVGLEECTNYGLDKNKKLKKRTKGEKRKLEDVTNTGDSIPSVKTKKLKLANGFVVESCQSVKPSLSNENRKKPNKKDKKSLSKGSSVTNINDIKRNENQPKANNGKTNKNQTNKKGKDTKVVNGSSPNKVKAKKLKLGENALEDTSKLTPEDMLSWAEFKLPDEIMRALTELGFTKPTKIQQLSLPAAIHGRRDILGAAETGSGKTLAFGLPILTGIMKLKEKALAKGLDVYEIPYKKSSAKKVEVKPVEIKKGKKARNKKPKKVLKEPSEDGYSSGDSNENEGEENGVGLNEGSKEKFLEEYDVPLRKKKDSEDEGNDSDDENYTHLSDMLNSDDEDDSENDEDAEGDDVAEDDDVSEDDDEEDAANDDASSDEDLAIDDEFDGNETEGIDEVDDIEEGIGCVRVEDNIELPGHVMVKTGKPLYALILTPTRELAIQVSRHLIAVAKYTGIRVATIVGGMAAVKQERVLRSGPEVVVATPGRLWELLNQGETHLQQLAAVKFLAIDETDRMVERGHFEELEPLLERLNYDETHRSARQNFVFSATLTMVHDLPSHMKGKKVTKRGKILNRKVEKMTPQQKIKKLVNMIGMTDPKVVDITAQNFGTAETLTECKIACSLEHKDAYLYYILQRHPGRTIVFCNSIGSVRRLAQLFGILKCNPLPLHASMPQRQRLKNLERFRDDPRGVLVATDVAARGLDIPDVDHVVHYQVPKTAENYVHRSGRTARANKEGLTILMMEPAEAYSYSKLCRTLNKASEIPTFPVQLHSIAPLKELVAVARELDALMLRKRRATQAQGWREKAAKELDMIIDEDDIPTTKMDPGIDKALNAKRRQLESILSRPLFPKGFSFKYPTLNDPSALKVTEENALQVMKRALETGELKREKRKSKNQPLLQLEKMLKK
ncbi:ATP-dependent RNA helicase DDX24 [Aricia agestis]|uniref:ATP-dependent RNA helicase DDX24 n=1 Tax=Aricia agestis TaxID=91739 RepID=UPI001C2061D5|nr:ATP-dependent RNA helicase DDX24 [Aricia agestis]